MAYLLGVDIGTSGTKTVLFDEMGNTLAEASREYPMDQPQNGWAEQDPEDWWKATYETIDEVCTRSGADKNDIKGIGLSGQMHGLVLLDAEGKPLRSSIIWCDNRTEPQCAEITEIVGREKLIEYTSNPALPAFTASKILWVKRYQPEIFEKTRHILLPKDYVRLRLTGEYATEVSDASGMQLLDVKNRCWSKEMCSLLDIPMEWLPRVYESHVVSGTLCADAAAATGLPKGVAVVGGGGDQAAGAVGNGIVRPGIFSCTLGTSGVMFAHTDAPFVDPKGRLQTFCHAVEGAWHVMGVTNSAGLSFQWFRNNFGGAEQAVAKHLDVDAYDLLTRQAEKAPAGCEGLMYLPYLMGERAPHLDATCRGVFFGLSSRHKREDMIRAVLEGVSYSQLDCLNIMRSLGIQATEIRASGGGGRSAFWRQMLADMFATPVTKLNSTQGPALGVAILAGVGTGVYSSVQEACEQAIQTVSTALPDEQVQAVYAKYYPLYQALYPALKPAYDTLTELNKV